jgi:single-stranded-DNA-specific exonuclease
MNPKKITDQHWRKEKADAGLVSDLKKNLAETFQLTLSEITCELLINRNFVDAHTAYEFLHPDLNQLHDPFIMADMDRAVKIIIDAISSKKRVWVYGDYDVDGITSVSIMILFLTALGVPARYYIPDRMSEGYGLNREAIDHIASEGADLLICVDCGISNHEEIDHARSLGMKVVVVDHHEVPEIVPPAEAILNPKQSRCPFPFRDLAGVGLTFNLLMALRKKLRENGHAEKLPNLKRYLDLVALGTIADIVPLVDENRLFVKFGLMELNEEHRPGIRALKKVAGVKEVTTSMVSFRLAPRINASGRMGSASFGVELLITDDFTEATNIARELDQENRKRQSLEGGVLEDALDMVARLVLPGRRSIVLASEEWHPGVIGIVASRLVERFYRPVILLAKKDGIAKGSARSISGFHVYEGLTMIEDLLSGFGGHKYAAGLSVDVENLSDFIEKFEDIVQQTTTEDDFIPTLTIDAQISLSDIKKNNLLHEAKLLMPFGVGNPEPLFLATGLVVDEARIVGKNHLRFVFKDKNDRWDAIAFNYGDKLGSHLDMVDAVFTLRENQWERGSVCELNIRDIKTA